LVNGRLPAPQRKRSPDRKFTAIETIGFDGMAASYIIPMITAGAD
jgi:hypothetical protein